MRYSAGLQPATVDRQRYSFSSGWKSFPSAWQRRSKGALAVRECSRVEDRTTCHGSELLASLLRSDLAYECDWVLLKGSAGI